MVDLAWMRSPEYRAAFKAVDDAGGIYDHRWGDAPIRTLLVLALLPLDEVHHFRINGYRHQGLLVTPGYVDILPPRRVNPGYPEAEWSADIGSAAITADQSRETILLLASLGALLLWFALRRHCGGWLCGAAQAGIGGASRVPAATAKEDVTVSGRRMVLHA